MAEEMGPRLGERQVLLRSVPETLALASPSLPSEHGANSSITPAYERHFKKTRTNRAAVAEGSGR